MLYSTASNNPAVASSSPITCLGVNPTQSPTSAEDLFSLSLSSSAINPSTTSLKQSSPFLFPITLPAQATSEVDSAPVSSTTTDLSLSSLSRGASFVCCPKGTLRWMLRIGCRWDWACERMVRMSVGFERKAGRNFRL